MKVVVVMRETDLPLGGRRRLRIVDGDGPIDGAGGEAPAAVVPSAARGSGAQLSHLPVRHSSLRFLA
jgi:hypothetical protein